MSQTPTNTLNIPPRFLGGGAEVIANTADQSPQNLNEIKRLDRAGGHCPQQPAQVVACRAQHRIDRISYRPFQPATTHSVIGLQVANYRFDRLSALQPAPLLLGQRFGFAAVDDFNTGVICIDPPPRVRIVVASIGTDNSGAMMRNKDGAIRTSLQGCRGIGTSLCLVTPASSASPSLARPSIALRSTCSKTSTPRPTRSPPSRPLIYR